MEIFEKRLKECRELFRAGSKGVESKFADITEKAIKNHLIRIHCSSLLCMIYGFWTVFLRDIWLVKFRSLSTINKWKAVVVLLSKSNKGKFTATFDDLTLPLVYTLISEEVGFLLSTPNCNTMKILFRSIGVTTLFVNPGGVISHGNAAILENFVQDRHRVTHGGRIVCTKAKFVEYTTALGNIAHEISEYLFPALVPAIPEEVPQPNIVSNDADADEWDNTAFLATFPIESEAQEVDPGDEPEEGGDEL